MVSVLGSTAVKDLSEYFINFIADRIFIIN
jgi:hypothetical protein